VPDEEQDEKPPAGTLEDKPADGSDHGSGLESRLERVEAAMSELKDWIMGQGGSPSRVEDSRPDIKAEVRAAVREVNAADRKAKDREAAETEKAQSIEDRISALEHVPEDKPFEYKRSTSLMGWAKP
jgi:hypothetical protein